MHRIDAGAVARAAIDGPSGHDKRRRHLAGERRVDGHLDVRCVRMPRLKHDHDGNLLRATVGAVRTNSSSYQPMKPAPGCQ